MIGCGKLGLPCAEAMSKVYNVAGYDVVDFTSHVVKKMSTLKEAIEFGDYIFLALPTPHDQFYGGEKPCCDLPPKNFNYDIVESVLTEIDEYADQSKLIILISTVIPGTIRKRLFKFLNRARFIYNPYLIAMGSVAWDMVNPEMVIIGTEDGSLTGDAKLLTEFYKPLMQNNPRYEIGTWEEAESIKIFYNTFISAKISLVNMIQDVAQKLGNINVDIVTNALSSSTMRIMSGSYMKAGLGDSGACHPRDNIALRWLSQDLNLNYDLFGAIMGAREVQAENIAKFLIDLSIKHQKKIFIHGKSYKPNVPYLHGSYSLLIASYIENAGLPVCFIDPLTNDFCPEVDGIILMAHHSPTSYSNTGLNHLKVKQRFYCDILPGSIVVDPWRYLKQDDVPGCVLISYGNTRAS